MRWKRGALENIGATPGDPPRWAALMATRRRKTLVVCADCHDAVHAQLPSPPTTQ
jgi:hypothetical protein